MTVLGVAGEERSNDLSRAERRVLRRRSMRLLISLLHPLRARLALTMVLVLVSTAMQAVGPAVIAWGIDSGLPALIRGSALPLVGAVAVYLVAGVLGGVLVAAYTVQTARISQAILLDLR
ncbi:MAG: ATP-binding cassette, subfamily bacterial, partial [Microbacteriaceae bacterium]|nr:ATP-binding cassette, subfamily bacterial [Microbacteriaceae bacterium]